MTSLQLNLLTKENKILYAKLDKIVKDASVECNNEICDDKELPLNNLSNASCAKSSMEAVKDSFGQSFQAGILLYLSYYDTYT